MNWAVVLGASAGTGAAIAAALAKRNGLDIFGVHRGNHAESADQLCESVQTAGRTCHMRIADAGTYAGAQQGADELLKLAGPQSVSFFVHSIACASVARLVAGEGPAPAHPKQVEKTFESMAHSFLWWSQALLERDLLAPGARLLALQNPMVDQVLRGTALVAAAKAALSTYIRHLAHEMGPLGYRVNELKFGAVPTRALLSTVGNGPAQAIADTAARAIPAGRLVTVEEVANFVALLALPEAAWLNGATLDFTGGETQALYDHAVHVYSPDASPCLPSKA